MASIFETHTARADALARVHITHTISYKSGATGAWRQVPVQGTYEEAAATPGLSSIIEQQIELMIHKSDLPAMPTALDRVKLPRLANRLCKPVNVRDDPEGAHWLFNVVKVNA